MLFRSVYKATEHRVPGKGKAQLVFTSESGEIFCEDIYDFECAGVLQGMYNKDSSIISFAHSCFRYALDTKQDLWFSTKDTISKKYDQTFKLIFEEIYEKDYKAEFEKLGIENGIGLKTMYQDVTIYVEKHLKLTKIPAYLFL